MVENLPQHYQSVNQIKKQRDCKNWNTHQWKRQISFKLLFFCFSFIKLVWDYNNFFCLIKDLQLCKSFITFHAPDSNLSLPFANSSYSDFDVFRPLYFSYFFYLFFFFFIINLTMEHPINFNMCIFAQKKKLCSIYLGAMFWLLLDKSNRVTCPRNSSWNKQQHRDLLT